MSVQPTLQRSGRWRLFSPPSPSSLATWPAGAGRGSIRFRYCENPNPLLLTAGERAVRLRAVHLHAVIEVGHTGRHVVNQLVHARHVLVLDVLRLVGDLVVVGVAAGGEEDDGNAIARVVRVVAATIDVLRMAVRGHRIIEPEGH